MVSVADDASRLLVSFMEGKADQAQVEQQLLELSASDAEAVTKVFMDKAYLVLHQAGSGHFQRSQRAGCALVLLAAGLDKASKKNTGDGKRLRRKTKLTEAAEAPEAPEAAAEVPEEEGGSNDAESKEAAEDTCDTVVSKVDAGSDAGVSKAVLDAVIEMTGGPSRAPKDKAQRAQTASFISDLVSHVGNHAMAKASLLEFAEDKVPGIREKALQGLSRMPPDDDINQRFMMCSIDNDKTVRTAAVASMSPSSSKACLATLLTRLDDTEACVRQALFNTLAREPEAVDNFTPGVLARLVVGLHDRSHLVQDAARKVVPKWVAHLGGPLQLLAKCDTFGDEFLGEDCASQLSQHCLTECATQSCQWFKSEGKCFPGLEKQAALLARFSVGLMRDDERDDAVDIPLVLKMVHEALFVASQDSAKNDFFLRQLLHVVSILDFCDEGSRRQLAKLTVDVLSTAPISSEVSAIPESGNRMKATVATTAELGVLLLRKCFGFDRNQGRRQQQENLISERVMAVIGDIVKVKMDSAMESQGTDRMSIASIDSQMSNGEAEPHFHALSRKLEAIGVEIADLDARKTAASDAKTNAIQSEDFEEAHRQKEVLATVEAELKPLKDQHAMFLAERDGICHRILAIVSALLKWTHSDIRKDGVLLGMLTGVVRPILKMQALSEEVNLRALHAIGLFCSIDVELAQNHWDFFTRLVTNLRQLQGDWKVMRTNMRRAMLAAATLSDCARIHGMNGFFDRDQILSAAGVLAAVPYEAREVAIYPLCGWFMSFGALYFEEHMTNPQPEITWALGWMLTEAFSNKARQSDSSTQMACGTDGEDDCTSESVLKTQATDLMVFFNILSKHPGRHGEALLCLAVESIIESGLWRCAVSLPLDAHNQKFTRGFSWPTLFEFVRNRLPPPLHLRLWRCCLQVCVTCPALAPWAQIPLALAAGVENAPPGAAELVKTAVSLGADADALSPIAAGMPPLEGIEVPEQVELLRPRAEAVKAEKDLVADLAELGVKMSEWAPAMDMKPPKGKPSVAVDGALKSVAMRSVGKAKRGGFARSFTDKALGAPENMPVVATPARAAPSAEVQVARAEAEQPAAMEVEAEAAAEPRGMKRMRAKTKTAVAA